MTAEARKSFGRGNENRQISVGVWRFSAVEKDISRRVQGKVKFGKRGGVAVSK